MKKMVIMLLIGILINPINKMYSQSIKFGWAVPNAGSKVLSMKFMPDQNYFICGTENNGLQIRKTEDGSLFKSYPEINGINDIEFTTDSTKIILAGATLQIRNLSDMSILTIDSTFKTDNLDQYYYEEIVVHPTKPIIFVKFSHYRTNNGKMSTNIYVYDIQNLKKSIELTDNIDNLLSWQNLKVSSDGKYLALATFEENKSSQAYLKIWNCETLKSVNKFLISDKASSNISTTVCLQFSQNSENIYLSGSYPDLKYVGAIIKYNISQNKIIEQTVVQGIGIEEANFILFNNENRMLLGRNTSFGKNINILNLKMKSQELTSNNPKNASFVNNIQCSKNSFKFLGNDHELIGFMVFDTVETEILKENQKNTNLYPNPTNGQVNINLNCMNQIHYSITNQTGQVLSSGLSDNTNNQLEINIQDYAPGIYFLKVVCEKESHVYKVIKE